MVLQELDFAGISKLIEDVGVPMIAASALDDGSGSGKMLTVPPGHCFIITRIATAGEIQPVAFDGSPNRSATTDVNGLLVNNAADTLEYAIGFRAFRRWQTYFEQAATPTWRTTPPNNTVDWSLKWPICIPPGWFVYNSGGAALGNGAVAYGYLIGTGHARTLGFDTNPSATDADRRYGVRTISTTASAVEAVAGRAGKHIQILDMFIRNQTEVPEVTNVLTIRQTDDRNIFKIACNNPNNFQEFKLSPGIFLAEGQGIEVLSTVTLLSTICFTYRFVEPEDVPGDHWWACTEPDIATPATTKVGTASNVTTVSTPVTCFYPRRGTTKTLPTQGFQHILRGYLYSMQKDTISAQNSPGDVDVSYFRISTGEGSVIGNVALGVTDNGVPISPVYMLSQQNQAVWGVTEGLNIVCPKDTGGISIDVNGVGQIPIAIGLTTPISTNLDVDNFFVTTWGKTIPARFHGQINRGAAS